MNAGEVSGRLPRLPVVGAEKVEEVERVRRGVCAYKECNLFGFGGVPVVLGSWVVVVEEEVEGATCILLLQLFWATTPVKRTKKWV